MLLIILVDELQYPVQSFLILCSHISTSVSIWDFISHNVIILRQKRNAIGLQKGKTRWRSCSSPRLIVCESYVSVKPTPACAQFNNRKQYSRIVADRICVSRILSEIRGYFHESRIAVSQRTEETGVVGRADIRLSE